MKLNYISLFAAAAIFVAPVVASAQNGGNDSQGSGPAASSDVGTPPAAATGGPTTAPGTVPPPPAPGAVPVEGVPDTGYTDSQDNNGGNSSSN